MEQLILKIVDKFYERDCDMYQLIGYIIRNKKTLDRVRYWNCRGVERSAEKAVSQMIAVQEFFGKANKRRIYHCIISFPKEVDDSNLIKLAAEDIADYIFEKYQVVYGIHEDTEHLHIHLAINAVSYRDGKKFHISNGEICELRAQIAERINKVFLENGSKQVSI